VPQFDVIDVIDVMPSYDPECLEEYLDAHGLADIDAPCECAAKFCKIKARRCRLTNIVFCSECGCPLICANPMCDNPPFKAGEDTCGACE